LHGKCSITVQNYCNQCVISLDFRLIAVYNVTQSSGSKTSGIDDKIMKSVTDKLEIVERLSKLENYKASPVKRVSMPKSGGKLRYLGIPTIYDRCVQSLFKLVLEPIVETFADPNSYGFRINRNAQQALALVRSVLNSRKNSENVAILNLDIRGFFDNINHT